MELLLLVDVVIIIQLNYGAINIVILFTHLNLSYVIINKFYFNIQIDNIYNRIINLLEDNNNESHLII